MAKAFKVVGADGPGRSDVHCSITDWKKCAFCQENTTERLVCPGNSTEGAGYKTMAENLVAFDRIGCLPSILQLSRLDEGHGIEATFRLHQAKWHDSCRLMYNKTKLKRAEKRKMPHADGRSQETRKYTRLSKESEHHSDKTCFFCGKSNKSDTLHNVSTFDLDVRVRQCALKLQDKPLLAKLSVGDLIAQEAKYHAQCLASLYNKARDMKTEESYNADDINHGIAFAGLVSYIEEVRMEDLTAPVFKLSDLVSLYTSRLEQLGTYTTGRVHSTKLKDRVLTYFPDMTAHQQGRDVVLVCNEDVGAALRKACEHDTDNEAVYLARVATIVRKSMLEMKQGFNGSFDAQSQEKSVPASLSALVSMILYGPNITMQYDYGAMPQPALTISQLLVYNSLRGKKTATTSRHNVEHETPLPVYLGIMIHTKTRKRTLVDTLFNLGLCISYDRLLDISTNLGNAVCHHYEMQKAVCPPSLKVGLFTTSAIDNIDHNPSSTSSHDSFHGTGISLFQHRDDSSTGVEQDIVANPGDTPRGVKRKLSPLPSTYTNVPPVAKLRKGASVPKSEGLNKADCQLMPQFLKEEYRWLEHVKSFLASDTLQGSEAISWAAYHSSLQQQPVSKKSVSITSLLPLFPDQAKSAAMICHAMNVVKEAVKILNPGQVPIITVDQPLYTVAKQIQWSWPETHGEEHFIVMFGGLHIEMTALKVIGNLLEESGWTGALIQAEIATSGTADSFLKASHVTRTRRAHQITATALYHLLEKAYIEYMTEEDDLLSFEDWCTEKAESCPQFHFWYIILQLELVVMIYIRAIRESNFLLYIDALTKVVPWFFALDHTHYARWIPVHLRDMIGLKSAHPCVYDQFMKGNFTVKKTTHSFSAIALDHAHEQNNASVKGDGGAVGLTENPTALRRWMVSGPEMARVIGEFETAIGDRKKTDLQHHEQTRFAQKAFLQDVKSLTSTIQELGNPFCENSTDLLVLDSRDLVDTAVIDTLCKIEKLGQDQYDAYVSERLVDQTKHIDDPIARNNLPLFSRPALKEKSKSQQQIASLKSDCSLFSRLYIASQIREGDLDEFFAHENQAYPPALSKMGKIRSGTKSDLACCLENLVPTQVNAPISTMEVMIIDGAAAVNMLRPGTAKTFSDYEKQVFTPYIKSQLHNVSSRLDVVWDEYIPESLKAETRANRGKGVRRRVEPSSLIPGKWEEFLRIDANKVELFSFLATHLASLTTQKQLITTHHKDVLCTQLQDVSGLSPCTHEEADTRILLHLEDAVKEGYSIISIRTVDTDVLVLAVTAAQRLNVPELWVKFGSGKSFRQLAAHEMARCLGPDRCRALPVFHAFTGCDTVSSFSGRGKKTAWDTWMTFGDVTSAFCALAATPHAVDEWIEVLERYVVLLYDRTSSQTSVNQARKELFTKGRAIDGLPPTQAALVQHIKRATYQAGYCWGQVMIAAPELPSPGDWGWKRQETGGWEICWTTLPEAAKACHELLHCGCKKGCRGRCKCVKAALQCTALCHCGGLCTQN